MTEIKYSDEEIQQAVLRELRWDTRVAPTEVGVEVSQGVVTLSGTVNSWSKRLAAQEAAHRVQGVRDVANDLEVKLNGGLSRTDTEIAQALRTSLEWNVLVPHERILSTVSKGWVTLEGDVETWAQHEDAENCARDLAGVTRVINKIRVRPTPKVTADLREAIVSALERQADREAKNVELTVSGDEVTVSGTVFSWREREAVLGAVRGTKGVSTVYDNTVVRPWA